MTKKISIKKMTRDEVIEELVEAYIENSTIQDVAYYGSKHVGYITMKNEDLESDYEYHFNEKIKIVEK